MKANNRLIKQNLKKYQNKTVTIEGWVRNNRDQKSFGFLIINDGTTLDSIQAVYDSSLKDFSEIQKIHIGSAISIEGFLVLTPESKQKYEIKLLSCKILGDSPVDYPIQPKRHTREFLREVAHLRPRTNLYNAVYRLRSVASFAIHTFFQKKGFIYINTPIITANDGEGAGQMFSVTTLPLSDVPKNDLGKVDYKKDFFSKQANLTVTGQLEAEAFALSHRLVYTFGPTFRAENSNTQTHASEFWMIEPEMAFCDLKGNMKVMEQCIKYVINYVLKKLPEEMAFFDNYVENGLLKKLENVINKPFNVVKHQKAIEILKNSQVQFEHYPEYGCDLSREHEKYLTEKHFNGPVFVIDWPKEIKAFYMKQNKDNKTVAAVDLLVPGSGELIGGSQREDDFKKLEQRMTELKISKDDLSWYLDLRKYGSCVHSGFGIGFDRLLMYISGIENIRDVIPFPRTPKNLEY